MIGVLVALLAGVFGGALAINAVPHLTKGMTGQRHQSPFRHGDTALVNAFWGWVSLAAGVTLLWVANGADHRPVAWIAAAIGSLAQALACARNWSAHPERNLKPSQEPS
jgi:hypothetical protein